MFYRDRLNENTVKKHYTFIVKQTGLHQALYKYKIVKKGKQVLLKVILGVITITKPIYFLFIFLYLHKT
jgi:hypothetical protein